MTDSLGPKSENSVLKYGYANEHQERWPINDDLANCSSESRAYFLSLEKEHLNIPPELKFSALKDDILPEHHERMEAIWHQVIIHRSHLLLRLISLRDCWQSVPRVYQKRVDDTLSTTPIVMQERFKAAIRGIISYAPPYDDEDGAEPTKLQLWKEKDRIFREALYGAHKKYIVALRLYYEMLLEKSKDKTEYVLPKDHPQRDNIMVYNTVLRLIDATYQSITAAKASHHKQKKRRLRKTEKVPFVKHPFDVTFNMFLHVLPFIIKERPLKHNPVIFALVGPIHDTVEDTGQSIESIVDELLKRLVDIYDTSFQNVIESGFENSPDDIKSNNLDLISREVHKSLIHILRIMSNNTILLDREKKAVIKLNIVGKGRTTRLLGLNYRIVRGWGIDPKELPEPKKTFQLFPEEYDDEKLTKFLIRLHAVTSDKKDRQEALILKIEDKLNNIQTSVGFPPEQQRRDIRAAITRLIAWIMLDHDRVRYPLYNSTHELIDGTVIAYENLMSEHPGVIEDVDHEYLKQLKVWQQEVERLPLPEKDAKVIIEHRKNLV